MVLRDSMKRESHVPSSEHVCLLTQNQATSIVRLAVLSKRSDLGQKQQIVAPVAFPYLPYSQWRKQ